MALTISLYHRATLIYAVNTTLFSSNPIFVFVVNVQFFSILIVINPLYDDNRHDEIAPIIRDALAADPNLWNARHQ